MKTAIVILNYNDLETTKNMLNNIKDYKSLDLIVVVDNKSIDNSYQELKKIENDKIIVIQTDNNLGYASGNNYGLEYLKDKNIDKVIISNPDILVSENVIIKLFNDLDKDDVTLVAPIIEENNKLIKGWKLPHFKEDLISNINYFHKYSNKLLSYKEDYYDKELVKVEVVHGCFFAIKYNDFKNINFFDPNTFLYYEENILGSKLKNNNLNSYIDTSVKVKHNLSISVDKSFNSLKKYKILKDSQLYYEKEYNHLNIFGIIILRLFYYISYFISYLGKMITGGKK